MKRPYFQKGWLDPGERRIGLIICRFPREDKLPSIELGWWWGWCYIFFAKKGKRS